jgi:hypothetical protein
MLIYYMEFVVFYNLNAVIKTSRGNFRPNFFPYFINDILSSVYI